MSNWLSHIANPEAIKAIYGEFLPRLNSCILHEITFHRDGPRAVMRIDLPDYPERAPDKWKAAEYNTVQINLMAVAISTSDMHDWNTDGEVHVELSSTDQGKTILAHSAEGLTLKIIAKSLLITEITAYKNSVTQAPA